MTPSARRCAMTKPRNTYANKQAVALPPAEHGSAQWQLGRANHIGASEVAAVLGVSKWAGLLDIVRTKRDLREGIVDENDNDAMRFGRDFEEFIVRAGMQRLGITTMSSPLAWTHPESLAFGAVSATPDALIIDERISSGFGEELVVATFEAKVDRSGADWQQVDEFGFADLEPGDIRLGYYLQVQAQLLVTGCKKGYLCVATGLGYDRIHLLEILEDKETQATIIEAAEAAIAWVNDSAGRWPAASDSDSLASLAATIRPKATDDSIMVSGAVEAAMEEYTDLNRSKKVIEDRQDALKKVIVACHAEGPKLHTASGIKSSFTPESSKEAFDAKAFEEAQPAMAALYRKTVTRSGGATITAPRAKKG